MVLLSVLVLWGATMGIVLIDRKRRDSKSAYALPADEPGVLSLFALTVLCNVACLPYYFFRTRGGAVGLLIGVGWFGFCFALTVGSSMILKRYS